MGLPRLALRRRAWDLGMRALLYLSAGLTCGLLTLIIGTICVRGAGSLSWQMLTQAESVLHGTVGILPALQNTLFVIVVSLLLVLPLGVGAAVYLTEYAQNRRLVAAIELATETLAGIPSILYALVGVIVFCTAWGLQKTLLSGALTLAVMNLPTVIRSTQESLKAVPQSYREGAFGLGSGRWHAVRTVVLPNAVDGIVTGCILAIGRVVGESAVLMYTAGLSTAAQDLSSLAAMAKASGATLTVALYLYAKERADLTTAFAIATVLLGMTVLLNGAAALAGRKLKKT